MRLSEETTFARLGIRSTAAATLMLAGPQKRMKSNWEQILKDRIQLYGHRNWLVIADSAYPAHSKPGIETIVVNEEQPTVLARVLAIFRGCKHVKPMICIDEEFNFIAEKDARGVTLHRKKLGRLLDGYSVSALRHEVIISKLDRLSEKFRVLLVKTNTRIPYTSIFFELACGYWDVDADRRLRAVMPFRERSVNGYEEEEVPLPESSHAHLGSKIFSRRRTA